MILLEYILIILLYCLEFAITFYFVNYISINKNVKKKSQILAIKSSFTMSIVGILFNYNFLTDTTDSIQVSNFGICSILYYTAYLICDMTFGYIYYPMYMNTLAGYIHHSVYILTNMLVLYTNNYSVYLINMLSEIPTFILNIGMYDNKYRNDNLFGTTFFIFRILYHMFLMYYFRNIGVLLFLITTPALILHVYWFSNWVKKYF